MQSSNGHGPKQAILYARVSTEEQARSGYSLAQQIEALREYAAREGYEILEEILDPGQSGASLERPGMDRVRDLVAAGGVSIVLAQERDRFSREPAYRFLLQQELKEYGCKLCALNDRGDESPEGELTDGILDQLAKFERAKTAERTRRGRLRKAREGKVIALGMATYGFQYNAARDGYVVDDDAMRVVRRIFYMIGVEGRTLHDTKKVFEKEGVLTPTGQKRWSATYIRTRVMHDAYRPHTSEEVAAWITPEVAARLDPNKRYGIWWYNRRHHRYKQTIENEPNGRVYRKQRRSEWKPKEEWIAVPVPDSGIPCEWVDAAREAIKDNRFTVSSAGGRSWQLSGGMFRCGGCGCNMAPDRHHNGSGSHKMYSYYRCSTKTRYGKGACSQCKTYRADETEALVWEFVSDLLQDPDRLQAGLERMIEQERNGSRGDPEREAQTWICKLAEVDRKRSSFQDMAAEGLITFEELRAKLLDLEDTRKTAEHELHALRDRAERVEALERDKDVLLAFAGVVPTTLDELTPEERSRLYKMLKLRLTAGVDGTLEVTGAFGSGVGVCKPETTS